MQMTSEFFKIFDQNFGKVDSFNYCINPTIFNIIRWVAGSIVSLTKCVMVQVLFW